MTRPLLLLLPGMLNTGGVFDRVVPLIDPLAEVIVIDQFSQSSMAEMAAYALTFLPPARRVHVAGFSMGGFVAQELLAIIPERIAGLAIVNSAIDVDGPEQIAIREKTIAAAERDFNRLCEKIIDFGLHPDHRTHADLRKAMRAVMDPVGVTNFIRQNRAVMSRRDRRALLAKTHAPLAVITSVDDEVVAQSRSLAILDLRPDATLTIVPRAGHMTVLENPQAVAAALNSWLNA